MTLTELKARAYDLIALKEQAQNELNQINQEIAKLYKEQNEVNNTTPDSEPQS
jgi:exonuclease VII small subunit